MTIQSKHEPFPFAGIDSYRVLALIGTEKDTYSKEANRVNHHHLLRSLQNMQLDRKVAAIWNVCRCGPKDATLAYAVLLESLNDIERLETLARIHGQDHIVLMYREGAVHSTRVKGVVRYTGRTTVEDEQLGYATWNDVGEQDILPWLYYVFAGVPGFLSFHK